MDTESRIILWFTGDQQPVDYGCLWKKKKQNVTVMTNTLP